MTFQLKSQSRMSNRQYQRFGKPRWWARTNDGFLDLPYVRGDDYLDVSVEIPDDCKEIVIGCGPNNRYGIREIVEVSDSDGNQ